MNHGFTSNFAAIRLTAVTSFDQSYFDGFACTHRPDESQSIHFDWIRSTQGLLGSFEDTSWSQCLGVYALTNFIAGLEVEASFLLMTPDLTVTILTINFEASTIDRKKSNPLSYHQSFDTTSLNAYGEIVGQDCAIIGRTSSYFPDPLSNEVGFVEFSANILRHT